MNGETQLSDALRVGFVILTVRGPEEDISFEKWYGNWPMVLMVTSLFLDKKTVLLGAFILLSLWSLSQGTLQLVQAEGSPDSPTKVNKEGTVEVELNFVNLKDTKVTLKDPKVKEPKMENVLIFDLALSSMDMSLSSFQAYDFKRDVELETDGGISVHPIDARITDWGHMGHHPRGRLIFPSEVGSKPLLRSRVVRVIIKDLGGIEKRVFEWKMPQR